MVKEQDGFYLEESDELKFLKNNFYVVYAVILAVVSMFTQEIVTFIMLGFVFMALLNINTTLQKILEKLTKN
ncbi:hypothetical protein ASG93_16555 [Paenibacillus sp. Soil787]|nr:hypothetical protein ASG93_16555 [Paenibacillus sp. Soil787]